MADQSTVSVVILSYNRPHFLRRSLDSIFAQTYRPLEILVVDNRSPNSEAIARIVEEYPQARLLANPHNTGFTGGMNQGIRAATGKYIYLTEDDVTTEPDSVRNFVAYAEMHPAPALLTGILFADLSGTISCAGADYDLTRPNGYLRLHAESQPDTGQFQTPFLTHCLIGAMVFGRTDYLQKLGGFREEFFMYMEDVELSERVRRSGGQVIVVPGAKNFPAGPLPPASGLNQLVYFHQVKNHLALYLLHAPARVFPGLFLHSVLMGTWLEFRKQRGTMKTRFKAFAWVLKNLLRLLRDRRNLQKDHTTKA